jgi:hypothetical protein
MKLDRGFKPPATLPRPSGTKKIEHTFLTVLLSRAHIDGEGM